MERWLESITLRSISILIAVLITLVTYYTIKHIPYRYVLNVYSCYPLAYWIVLFLLYLLILLYGFIHSNKKSIFIFAITTLYLIPFVIISGYYLPNRGDDLSHLGEIKYIAREGHFLKFNPYPATHILFAIVVQIANIDYLSLIHVGFPFLSLLFILGIYTITKRIIMEDNTKHNLDYFPLLVSLLYIYYLAEYHITLRPHQIAFIVFPFILLVTLKYFTSKKPDYFILLVIFSVFLTTAHLIVAIVYALAILAILVSTSIINKENPLKLIIENKNILLLSTISTVIWAMYNYSIYNAFSNFLGLYLSGRPVNVMLVTEGLLKQGRFTITEIITRGIMLYLGRYVFLLSVFTFCIVYSLINSRLRKEIFKDKTLQKLILLNIFFGIIQGFFFVIPFSKHNPQRFLNLNIAIYIFIPLLILFFNKFLRIHKKMLALFIVAIIVAYVTSLLSIIPSPLIFQPNNAITYNEINGLNWLDKYKTNLDIRDFSGELVYRYYSLKDGWFYTREYNKEIMKLRYSRFGSDNSRYMNHLLYDRCRFFPLKNYYISITTNVIKSYLELPKWKDVDRLNYRDLIKFYTDYGVDKIYDSLNIDIFKT